MTATATDRKRNAAVAKAIYAVEMLDDDGPTGIIREVLALRVEDWAGNVLWRGTPGHEPKYQIPVRLVATKLGAEVGECYETLCDWDDVDEE